MAAEGVALRPLGLGELLDRAIAAWRAHWKPLFLLCLPFQLVEFIVFKVGTVSSRLAFPLMRGDAAALEVLKADPAGGALQLLGFLAVLGATLLLMFLVAQVAGVGVTRFLYPRVLGRPGPGAGESGRQAVARLGPAAGAFALAVGWSAVVAALALLPGASAAGAALLTSAEHPLVGASLAVAAAALLGLASLLLILWFVIRFVLVSQVIGAEGAGAWDAFTRAGALTRGRVEPGPLGWVKLRLAVLLTVVTGLLLLVTVVNALPLLALGLAWGATLTPGNTLEEVVPAAVLVPVEVAQVVVGALFSPISEAFKLLFYVDLRVRREGLDLELALQGADPR